MRNTKLKIIKPDVAKLYNPCPKHGRKHLVREGKSVFCFAKTKMDIIDRCFYHVGKIKLKVKSKKLKVKRQKAKVIIRKVKRKIL